MDLQPSIPLPTLVWLFDIDGTLLLTEGAGREAMAAAVKERYGVADDLRSIAFAGRTDPLIVTDIATKHGLPLDDPAENAAFWPLVHAHMRRVMDPPRGGLLPGVPALLDAVDAEPSWLSALLTGNQVEMAHIKLGAFGVRERFAFGAFGDEAVDRNALAILAVERAWELTGLPANRCIVVGDTEHDIACARAAGAHAVAVATGGSSRDVLAAHAPDLLLDSLADPARLLAWARTL